jgi:hypothetical protein
MLLKFVIACIFPFLLFLMKFYTADEKAIVKQFFKGPRLIISEIIAK